MDNIYRDNIIDHYQNPRNLGDLADADVVVKEANASCGDMLQLALKFKDGQISDIKFKSIGCAISTAAGSLLTERILGRKIDEIKDLAEKDMVEMLGIAISPTRMKCALLPLKALRRALEKYE